MKPQLSLLTLCLMLTACGSPAPRPESGVTAPAAWQSPTGQSVAQTNQQWWTHFASPHLNLLIGQAQSGSHDLAAAIARYQQAGCWMGSAAMDAQGNLMLQQEQARIMREGNDVTLVSYSIGVGVALEAAEKLSGEGIEAELVTVLCDDTSSWTTAVAVSRPSARRGKVPLCFSACWSCSAVIRCTSIPLRRSVEASCASFDCASSTPPSTLVSSDVNRSR